MFSSIVSRLSWLSRDTVTVQRIKCRQSFILDRYIARDLFCVINCLGITPVSTALYLSWNPTFISLLPLLSDSHKFHGFIDEKEAYLGVRFQPILIQPLNPYIHIYHSTHFESKMGTTGGCGRLDFGAGRFFDSELRTQGSCWEEKVMYTRPSYGMLE